VYDDWSRHERVLLGHQPQQVIIREGALVQPHLPVLHRTAAEQLLGTAYFPRKLLDLTPLERLRLHIAKTADGDAAIPQVLESTLTGCTVRQPVYLNTHVTPRICVHRYAVVGVPTGAVMETGGEAWSQKRAEQWGSQ